MTSSCPSCGHLDYDSSRQCVCGFHGEKTLYSKSTISTLKKGEYKEAKNKVPKDPVKSTKDSHTGENVIKEIDSWRFTYSRGNNSMYLGTPALQSFRLELTIDDLEELLEFMYEATGAEKTTKKLKLSAEELPAVIHRIHSIIEEKRAKIPINLDSIELDSIADLINAQLIK